VGSWGAGNVHSEERNRVCHRGAEAQKRADAEKSEERKGIHPRVDGKYAQASRGAGDRGATWRIRRGLPGDSKLAVCRGTPLPLCFSQVLILKVVKVVCFDKLLQVLILEEM